MLGDIKNAWSRFDLESIDSLEPLYDENIRFIEPAGEILGRNNLFNHFRQSCQDLIECRFEFDASMEVRGEHCGFLVWTMHYRHRKIRGGELISVPGTTYLSWGEKIELHRDWFDLGAAVYEQIPVVGFAVKSIKNRMHTSNNS